MNKKVIRLIMLGIIAITASLTGCGKKEEAPVKPISIVTQEQKAVASNNQKIAREDSNSSIPDKSKKIGITKDEHINTINTKKVECIDKIETNKSEKATFNISSLSKDVKIVMNTPWEKSPNGKYEATVEGKGESSEEEGIATIIIRDVNSGAMKRLELDHGRELQKTPKTLEWADDSNIYVIIGKAFGTVTKGGKIYKVNIIDGTAPLIADTKNKEEFSSIHRTSKGITVDKYVYEDDNYIKGHIETINIP